MKNKLFASIPAMVLGLLIAVGPQTFAHVCRVQEGKMPMACHYTAHAALGVGIIIMVLGLCALLFNNAGIRAGINIAVALLGVLVICVPTVLIGVCKGAMMHCHMVTLPTLIVLGVLTIVFGVIAVVMNARADR